MTTWKDTAPDSAIALADCHLVEGVSTGILASPDLKTAGVALRLRCSDARSGAETERTFIMAPSEVLSVICQLAGALQLLTTGDDTTPEN